MCGACNVLLDGVPVRSCIVLTAQAEGHAVTTVEGLAPAGELSDMQKAFIDHQALQCGFCTSGILVTLAGVDRADYCDEEAIRELLSGNLCRCTGYQHIVEAIRDAWKT